MFKKSYFKGQFIQVTTKTKISTSYTGENNSPMKATTPLSLQGYLIDQDRENYYMGDDNKTVVFAVAKSDVIIVEKINPKVAYKNDIDDSVEEISKDYFYGGTTSKLSS